MIRSIFIDGVKTFADPTTITTGPITILTGSNSCGKSTAIQSLLVVKQLATLPSRASTLVRLNGPIVAQGSYRDWSTQHEEKPFSLGLVFTTADGADCTVRITVEKGGNAPGDARLSQLQWEALADQDSYRATFAIKSTDDYVRELSAAFGGTSGTDETTGDRLPISDELPYEANVELAFAGGAIEASRGAASLSGLAVREYRRVEDTGPAPIDSALSSHPSWDAERWNRMRGSRLQKRMQQVFHLGPLREEPRMIYSGHRALDVWDVGARGERAALVLAEFGKKVIDAPLPNFARGTRGVKLVEAVAEWAQRIGVASTVEVQQSTKYGTEISVSAAFSADRAAKQAVRADLVNVGIGVSQVLPLLVLCLAAPPGSTVLLEQPELHLHPAVQSRLGDFFASCAMSGRQVILETHSEHLINRLRLLVAQGHLDPNNDLALNFIERDRFGSEVTTIGVGRDGSLDRWPRGFFDESQDALRKLMKERFRA